MKKKQIIVMSLLALLLTGCSNAEPAPETTTINLEYEAKLIEYKVCIEASAERWKKLTPDLPGDIISGVAKKECEKLFPTP